MTLKEATHWLVTTLREERDAMIAARGGWQRPEIVKTVREKYAGTSEWLEMQAAIASHAIGDKMWRILQQLARTDPPGQLDGFQKAIEELDLHSSYVVSFDGSEQATELMTGEEARIAIHILRKRIADDTTSCNRLVAALEQYPQWVGSVTLLEALEEGPGAAAA